MSDSALPGQDAPNSAAPRGSAWQDAGLGCLGAVGFSIVLGAFLAIFMLFLPMWGFPPEVHQALSDSVPWIQSGFGIFGFAFAFRMSERARARHGSVLEQVAPVVVVWAVLLVMLSMTSLGLGR